MKPRQRFVRETDLLGSILASNSRGQRFVARFKLKAGVLRQEMSGSSSSKFVVVAGFWRLVSYKSMSEACPGLHMGDQDM